MGVLETRTTRIQSLCSLAWFAYAKGFYRGFVVLFHRKGSRDVWNGALVFMDPDPGDSCGADLVILNSVFGGCSTGLPGEVRIELRAPLGCYK